MLAAKAEGKSNREAAKEAGVDHKTVAKWTDGEFRKPSGIPYPKSKAPTTKPKEANVKATAAPAIEPRPDHLTGFGAWLNNGGWLVRQFKDANELLALAARRGLPINQPSGC